MVAFFVGGNGSVWLRGQEGITFLQGARKLKQASEPEQAAKVPNASFTPYCTILCYNLYSQAGLDSHLPW